MSASGFVPLLILLFAPSWHRLSSFLCRCVDFLYAPLRQDKERQAEEYLLGKVYREPKAAQALTQVDDRMTVWSLLLCVFSSLTLHGISFLNLFSSLICLLGFVSLFRALRYRFLSVLSSSGSSLNTSFLLCGLPLFTRASPLLSSCHCPFSTESLFIVIFLFLRCLLLFFGHYFRVLLCFSFSPGLCSVCSLWCSFSSFLSAVSLRFPYFLFFLFSSS